MTLLASGAFGIHHKRCRANITHISSYAPPRKKSRAAPGLVLIFGNLIYGGGRLYGEGHL